MAPDSLTPSFPAPFSGRGAPRGSFAGGSRIGFSAGDEGAAEEAAAAAAAATAAPAAPPCRMGHVGRCSRTQVQVTGGVGGTVTMVGGARPGVKGAAGEPRAGRGVAGAAAAEAGAGAAMANRSI